MSSLIFPKVDSTKSTGSIIFTIFILIVGLISLLVIPDFSSGGQLFGIIFLTTLGAVIFSSFDLIKKLPLFYMKDKFDIHGYWIGEDKDLVVKHSSFLKIFDSSISKYIFSIGLFTFGLLCSIIGLQLFNSIFELSIISSICTIVPQIMIGVSLMVIAWFMNIRSRDEFVENHKFIWLILWKNRLQRNGNLKWVKTLNEFIKDSEYEYSFDEVNEKIYKITLSKLEILQKQQNNYLAVIKKLQEQDQNYLISSSRNPLDKRIIFDFPELSVDYSYWAQRNNLNLQNGWDTGHTLNDKLKRIIDEILTINGPEGNFNGFEILFSVKSQIKKNALLIRNYLEDLSCIDYYLSKFHEYHTHFILPDIESPEIIMIDDTSKQKIDTSHKSYILLLSTIHFVYYIKQKGFLSQKNALRVRWMHRENLRTVETIPSKKFQDEMEKYYSHPISKLKNKYGETGPEIKKQLDEFLNQLDDYILNKRSCHLGTIIELNELKRFLVEEPFNNLIEKLIELRYEKSIEFQKLIEAFPLEIDLLMNSKPKISD